MASSFRQTILFLIDTQGANVVGCYRPDLNLETPNIDRLAAGGVRFDRAYTCSPVCGPARSALMTGLYPHSNGVLGNDLAPHLDLPTIGQRLRHAGIHTGYIGKWHLDGTDYFGDGRCPPGWDSEFWFDGRNYLDSLPDQAARDLSRVQHDADGIRRHGITSEFTHAHRIADRARAFIERHRHEDFFLVVSIDEPHHPFICPEPFASRFEDFRFPVPNADDPLSGKPLGQHEWAEAMKSACDLHLGPSRENEARSLSFPIYFGCNSYCDAQIGRVLEAVDRHTPAATVIHTSDHGDMLSSHGLFGKGPAMYEEVVRIPLIIRSPERAPGGVASGGLVSHIDLVPTILELHGLDIPPLLQGRSLVRQMADPLLKTRDAVFLEFNRFEVDHDGFGAFAPIRCASDGRFKLSLNLLETDEFYDLQADPMEMKNLISEGSEECERLFRELTAWMNSTRDPLRGPHWLRRPWRGPVEASSWRGPTRPRPFDPDFFPKTLLYVTGAEIDRLEYAK